MHNIFATDLPILTKYAMVMRLVLWTLSAVSSANKIHKLKNVKMVATCILRNQKFALRFYCIMPI